MSDHPLQPTPVHGRDDSPTRLLNLFTLGEFALLAVVFVTTQVMFRHGLLSMAAVGLTVVYARVFKKHLPERFVANFVRFQLHHHFIYRAAAADTAWRPPIVGEPHRPRASAHG